MNEGIVLTHFSFPTLSDEDVGLGQRQADHGAQSDHLLAAGAAQTAPCMSAKTTINSIASPQPQTDNVVIVTTVLPRDAPGQ